jgi:hypothetical protein
MNDPPGRPCLYDPQNIGNRAGVETILDIPPGEFRAPGDLVIVCADHGSRQTV